MVSNYLSKIQSPHYGLSCCPTPDPSQTAVPQRPRKGQAPTPRPLYFLLPLEVLISLSYLRTTCSNVTNQRSPPWMMAMLLYPLTSVYVCCILFLALITTCHSAHWSCHLLIPSTDWEGTWSAFLPGCILRDKSSAWPLVGTPYILDEALTPHQRWAEPPAHKQEGKNVGRRGDRWEVKGSDRGGNELKS
jgi:hypothetical protein